MKHAHGSVSQICGPLLGLQVSPGGQLQTTVPSFVRHISPELQVPCAGLTPTLTAWAVRSDSRSPRALIVTSAENPGVDMLHHLPLVATSSSKGSQ
jgi:hypothetical protein